VSNNEEIFNEVEEVSGVEPCTDCMKKAQKFRYVGMGVGLLGGAAIGYYVFRFYSKKK